MLDGGSILSCPYCPIPRDNRAYCRQWADHYSPCGTDGCGADQQRWHQCWRCCYPDQGYCDYWNSIDKGCVYSDCDLTDSCEDCEGNCPSLGPLNAGAEGQP